MVERDESDLEEREPNPLEKDVLSHTGVNINVLVKAVSDEANVTRVDSVKGLYRALEDGKVRLIDPHPPRNLASYVISMYNLWFWMVIGFIAIVSASIYLIPQIFPLTYLRYATGAIYVLYIPGYTLIEALYPKREDLERLERFALGIGLSIALVPLFGLVLNYTPWGIRLDPVFAGITVLTILIGIWGVYRKNAYFQLTLIAQKKKPV